MSSNGCGCSSGLLKFFKPPYAKKFYEACVKHDQDYDRGGSSFDRYCADLDLYGRMTSIIHMEEYKPWRVTWLTLVALTYYVGVRLFGWHYYKYKQDG